MQDCVSFVDDYDDSDIGMRRLFQKVRREWFDTEDKTQPLWKAIVVNRVHVQFVYHHAVCDKDESKDEVYFTYVVHEYRYSRHVTYLTWYTFRTVRL